MKTILKGLCMLVSGSKRLNVFVFSQTFNLIKNYIPPPKISGSAPGSKFGAACFTFTETSSVVTGCFLGKMNTDVKKLFSVFVSYQTFLMNMPAKDYQKTAKNFGRAEGVNSLLFLHSPLIHYVYPLLRLR